jgi:hypothetical protein
MLSLSWSLASFLASSTMLHAAAAAHLEVVARLVILKLYVQALLYANLRCSKRSSAAKQRRQLGA